MSDLSVPLPGLASTSPIARTPSSTCGCGKPNCSTCATDPGNAVLGSSGYVYALGRIEPRFPNLSLEKELAQATGRAETAGLGDREAVQKVLSKPENAYIARQLCWVLSIEGIDAYVVLPRDAGEVNALIASLRPTPRVTDVDVLIGTIGPPAPSRLCNGLELPIVLIAQIYSFDVESFIEELPVPKDVEEDRFAATIEEVLQRVLQLADNLGLADGHRALNYLATRYPALYTAVAKAHAADAALEGVELRPSRLSSGRQIYDVVFTFRNRHSDVAEKVFVRVDVTELFPFLVTKLSPYYDR